jgi:hypothetical protein
MIATAMAAPASRCRMMHSFVSMTSGNRGMR